MATADTCELTPPHPPKPASIATFKKILPEVKRQLIHLRHAHDKHEPQYFQAVSALSDDELIDFDEKNLIQVRAGNVAYGLIVFGKVVIPAKAKLAGAVEQCIFVRWFVGGEDDDGDGQVEKEVKFHSIYTEEKENPEGGRSYRAIVSKDEASIANIAL
jgi:hypothetical protein